jgi:flavin reductase (DIM6/NTAB) family NADH-FMN oxidoreductase RutF/2-polyprenyl-6-methoxyphenol hydroxylase-like FAD-dependent oxidoreductase
VGSVGRRVAIVGAGQSGAQLGLGLLRQGYDVTIVSNRSSHAIRTGPVMSSQCMFSSALQTERALGLEQWAQTSPSVDAVAFTRLRDDGSVDVSFEATLDGPAHSVDQRIKVAAWLDLLDAEGATVIVAEAAVDDLERLAAGHDLVVIATGVGELATLFARDDEHSPFDRPQRSLALTYVRGMERRRGPNAVSFNVAPGAGEFFTFPALTTSGQCDILVFEALPGGPMDLWAEANSPDLHLARSLEALERFFPHEFARTRNVSLTDERGVRRGRITPTVRRPVGILPSGVRVLGMADAVVLNDPLTGQGANTAAKAAGFYLDSIAGHEGPFDDAWMYQTFDNFWRGWAQWVVAWTNAMLDPPRPHVLDLLGSAQRHPPLAAAVVNGFDDPRTFHPWWFDPAEAARFAAAHVAAESARFDPRELRQAMGQYATGVTVMTARGRDGRNVAMTANSFTSVSLDPPLVLWCVDRAAESFAEFATTARFVVNVLAADQHHLSRQFATQGIDKFTGVSVRAGTDGLPILEGTVATFECRSIARYDGGDHLVLVGEIEGYDARGGEPLVFHSGYYRVATRHPDI